MKTAKLRIVVLGMMGRCPFAGQTWLYLNWLSGLKALGHDVWYVEDDTVWPYDPKKECITNDSRYAIEHISRSLEPLGMGSRWAYRLSGKASACANLSPNEIDGLYRTCDVLLNIVGATFLRDEQMSAGLRVYVETDPVSAELMLANGDRLIEEIFASHHRFATYGENYGAKDCGVPLSGIDFIKTRQPIDLSMWPYSFDPNAKHFTTIGNYRQGENQIEYNGRVYHWSKHREWERFADIPNVTGQTFEVALMLREASDRRFLESRGWRLVSPAKMTLDVFGAYPAFIRASRAELTVAKEQNIALRSGWFSERDACYLASGKPVVAQDTAFNNVLRTGEGLFAFNSMTEAAEAVKAINDDYERHCKAARAIAEEYFDSRLVAGRLLADLGLE